MREPALAQLAQAYAQISRGVARKEVFAAKAEQDGRPELAALLRAAAKGQEVQAHRLLMLLRGRVADSEANAREAFVEEPAELGEELEALERAAGEAGDSAGAGALGQVRVNLARHQSLYEALGRGEAPARYAVCQVCGYVHPDAPPAEGCPVCGAVPARFDMLA